MSSAKPEAAPNIAGVSLRENNKSLLGKGLAHQWLELGMAIVLSWNHKAKPITTC